jgi:hypothetical protein
LFLLFSAIVVSGPFFAFLHPVNVRRFPWLGPALKIGMAVFAPIGGGLVAILMLRHLLWLFGRGPHFDWVIGPPPRVNCVIMMFGGQVALGIALEHVGFVPSTLTLVGSSIWGFFSLTGFLWAQAEARKCRKDAV